MMKNWEQRIREHFAASGLPREMHDEVVRELAAHLEETYNEARAAGMTEAPALAHAMQEVHDWRVVANDICRAKSKEDLVNQRTGSLWLPALVTLVSASVSLMVCQLLGIRPQLIWVAKMGMTFYWPWLATLPLFGAAGAYLSQRAQGTILAKLAASLSPALVMLTVMLVVLPWGLYLNGLSFFRLVAFGLGVINWGVIPACALLLGATPFLKDEKTRAAVQL